MNDLVALALQLLLLLLSAFCSASEAACFVLDRSGRAELLAGGGAPARLIRRFDAAPEKFLLALLLVNLLFNLGYFTVGAAWSMSLPGLDAALLSAAVFLVMLVAGEVVPKAFAVRSPKLVVRLVAAPLDAIVALTGPIVKPLSFATNVLTGMITPREDPPAIEPDEFLQLVRAGAARGAISAPESEVLERIVHMTELRARDAMEARVRIAAIDLTRGRGPALETVRRTRRSKLPVHRGDIDHVEGYIEGKDLFLHPDAPLEKLVLPIRFVSESTRLDATLRLLRRENIPIAIALDEYGGTAGVLTDEGIASVLFGGLADEHQKPRGFYRMRADGAMLVRGTCPVATFNRAELARTELPAGRATTMAGFVAAALDRIPNAGDEVRFGDLDITVMRVANGVARILLVEPVAERAPHDGSDAA